MWCADNKRQVQALQIQENGAQKLYAVVEIGHAEDSTCNFTTSLRVSKSIMTLCLLHRKCEAIIYSADEVMFPE